MLNDPNISVRKFAAFVADMAASATALTTTCFFFLQLTTLLANLLDLLSVKHQMQIFLNQFDLRKCYCDDGDAFSHKGAHSLDHELWQNSNESSREGIHVTYPCCCHTEFKLQVFDLLLHGNGHCQCFIVRFLQALLHLCFDCAHHFTLDIDAVIL